MEPTIYTVLEVAKLLRVNKNFVYKLIKSGHMRAIKIGTIKITSTALSEFLEKYDGQDFSDFNDVKPLIKEVV